MSHHLQPAVGRRSVALADSRSAARSLKWENKKKTCSQQVILHFRSGPSKQGPTRIVVVSMNVLRSVSMSVRVPILLRSSTDMASLSQGPCSHAQGLVGWARWAIARLCA